ncbi:uncharacterized protein LOC62_05G006773 [Vanrija pseudolonga]|uniref:Uncharacterized protein n=1 Tax=Vanrija pseudolonga TaxID=143232 RepID=A0AAF1BMB4_9TREE|nr:hypothetical protein LOC62_05G006773 [Vanrija pseudolonga]
MASSSFQTTHPQPFTLAEAQQLDVGVIVAEITRLQNSLAHLATSQAELASFLAEDDDPDLRAAYDENAGVIASQEERVAMLRHVLEGKVGRESLGHYGIAPADETTTTTAAASARAMVVDDTAADDDDAAAAGLHL